MNKNINLEDDFCDIYERKICDNCGKCLEQEGVDTKAIKIEEIAKKVEENTILEEEFIQNTQVDEVDEVEGELTPEEWEKLVANLPNDSEYEDAFDHIEYMEDMDLNDDLNLEEMTVEIYPGVRKLKGSGDK